MKRKSVAAVVLLIVIAMTLTGCNYVSRPVGAGNNATDTSNLLTNLLKTPTKTTVEQVVENVETVQRPTQGNNNETPPTTETPGGNENENENEPTTETPTSPFQVTTDVFNTIGEMLTQVSDDIVDTNSATGVSDELMSGRTVYVYTPYDISGKDDEMMKAVANNLNMTVVRNNLGTTGVAYSVQMRKVVLSDTKADLMFVDQNIWGDIQYCTQPLTSFVNFELGDKLGSFHSSMSGNYSISDAYYESAQTICDYYVAAGIGAPYLLAYNKANLVSTGTLAEGTDADGMILSEVKLADPVTMYNNGTWGMKAMEQMLINSTVGKCVGLGSSRDTTSSVNWWFGCDNVPGFKLNVFTKSAIVPTDQLDYYSVSGMSRFTLDTIQDMFWNTTGANDMNVASFFEESEKDKAISKLFNKYIGTDAASKYAMVGIEADDLANVFAQAGDADWDFVGYPYGTATENIVRSANQDEEGNYLVNDEQDIMTPHTAGWSSGFAVLERCANPSVALRFAEDYTLAWQEDYESAFMDLLSDEQAARYEDMKNNMGVTFYTSMMSHVVEADAAYPGASAKISSDALSASAEFSSNVELFTQPIFYKDIAVGSYNPASAAKWSDFINITRASGMAGSYELARVMFNY